MGTIVTGLLTCRIGRRSNSSASNARLETLDACSSTPSSSCMVFFFAGSCGVGRQHWDSVQQLYECMPVQYGLQAIECVLLRYLFNRAIQVRAREHILQRKRTHSIAQENTFYITCSIGPSKLRRSSCAFARSGNAATTPARLYVCTYLYIDTHTHTYIHRYTHTFIHTFGKRHHSCKVIYTYISVCVCVCVCVYIYI